MNMHVDELLVQEVDCNPVCYLLHRMYSGRKGDASIVMDLNVPIAGDVLIRVRRPRAPL